jgi:hypothetical protein
MLASVAVLAAMAWPLARGRLHTHDDLGGFHLPTRAFYAERLAHGEPWDWMPHLFGGFYLTGEGQAGTYHPVHWLLYRWLPLSVAFELELWLSYPLMLIGAWLWLRRRLGRSTAAIFGAAVWTFSSFNLLRFVHPNAVAVTAHVPWLLWTLDVALTDPRRRQRTLALLGVSLLTGSQLLLGYPQYVWFSLLAEALWTLLLLGQRRGGRWFSCLLTLGWAKLLGLLLAAVQVLPTLDALMHSTRAQVGVAPAEVGAVGLLDLAQIVGPYLFQGRAVQFPAHEFPLYFGAVPLVLVAWLFARRRRWGMLRPWIRAAAAVAGLSLVVAFGRAGLLARGLEFIPVVAGFRCPCRYLVLTHLAMAGLAAIGFLRLTQANARPKRRDAFKALWCLLGTSLLVALVGLALRHRLPIAAPKSVFAGPLLVAVAAWLVARAERGARWAPAVLVLLALGDLSAYGFGYAIWRHTHTLGEYIALAARPPADGPPGQTPGADLHPDEPTVGAENTIVLAGWRRMDGYAGLEPWRQLDYQRVETLRVAGVRWVRANRRTRKIAGLSDRGAGWLEVPRPLSPIRLVTHVRVSRTPRADVAAVALESTALVEVPVHLPRSACGGVAVVARRPGRLDLEVACPDRQVLIVSEGFDCGWRATAQGQPRQVLRVNGDFLGCVVEPGDQRLTLEFRPVSLRWGWVVSIIVLGVHATWLVWGVLVGWGRFSVGVTCGGCGRHYTEAEHLPTTIGKG